MSAAPTSSPGGNGAPRATPSFFVRSLTIDGAPYHRVDAAAKVNGAPFRWRSALCLGARTRTRTRTRTRDPRRRRRGKPDAAPVRSGDIPLAPEYEHEYEYEYEPSGWWGPLPQL